MLSGRFGHEQTQWYFQCANVVESSRVCVVPGNIRPCGCKMGKKFVSSVGKKQNLYKGKKPEIILQKQDIRIEAAQQGIE